MKLWKKIKSIFSRAAKAERPHIEPVFPEEWKTPAHPAAKDDESWTAEDFPSPGLTD